MRGQRGGRSRGWFPYATESKSAMCNGVGTKREEGTGDCDNLLIHGQRWAGGCRIGQYNEAHLEDCTEQIHTPLLLVLPDPAQGSHADLASQLMPLNPSALPQAVLNLELDSLMTL